MQSSRYHFLDSMRGIAALVVVVHHYFFAFYPYTVFGTRGASFRHSSWEGLFHYFPFNLLIAGHFAVCLFFILSGFVLSHGYLGVENVRVRIAAALLKRPIRLGGLVVFTILVACILWYFGFFYNSQVSELSGSNPFYSDHWKGKLPFDSLPLDMSLWAFRFGYKYNPPLWTINIELYGSFLVFSFLLLFGNNKWRLLILAVAFIALTRYYYYQCFLIGIMVADIIKNHGGLLILARGGFWKYPFLVAGLFLACYPLLLDDGSLGAGMYGFLPHIGGNYCMLGSILVFVSIMVMPGVRRFLETGVLKFLGRISYGLYAFHYIVMASLSSWMFLKLQRTLGYDASFGVAFIVGLPIIIALSYAVTVLVDESAIRLSSAFGGFIFSRLELIASYRGYKKAPDL